MSETYMDYVVSLRLITIQKNLKIDINECLPMIRDSLVSHAMSSSLYCIT